MFKKGGIFLGILLCASFAFAQGKAEDMFREDNPNLMNLNEAREYTGSPLIYIQGVKAPEKATNDIEALQLKLFGTKNVQEATKNTLELTPNTLPELQNNQIPNYTFQTPFHQTVQAGFIRHIPAFFTMIYVLDQQHLRITESVTVMNTEQDAHWTRNLPLPIGAKAQLIHYSQNGQDFSLPSSTQNKYLFFKSPKALELGPNQLSFTYQIENPFNDNYLKLNLTGQEISWAIASFKAAIFFPTQQDIQESQLVFGTNKLQIQDIYTQQMDINTNINYEINRIIPPNADIQLQLKLDPQKLPQQASDITNHLILYSGLILLCIYWVFFGWWEKKRFSGTALPKIKYPQTLLTLADQMGTNLTPSKWQKLLDFGKQNNWPLEKLESEQAAWQKSPLKETRKASIKNFSTLIFEPFVGTLILVLCLFIAHTYAIGSTSILALIFFITASIIALCLLYFFSLKKTRLFYWKKKLTQLSNMTILSGVTSQQVRQIYPLFILTCGQEEWRKNLIKVNPKIAQETHLLKEEQ